MVSPDCPRIVVAGTQSGVGKTSVALGLARAYAQRGLKVQTFKVGPDFLDPTHLALASGRPCYNLDTWMMGRDYVLSLFARATNDADLAIVEGVMGFFDGYDPSSSAGSTAEMAGLLGAPVVLVANVHGMARSIAALVKGYAEFEKNTGVAAVVLNQCGSENHGRHLGEALQDLRPLAVAGAIPRGGLPVLPSRHLGLVTADEKTTDPGDIDALADAVEKYCSLDEIMKIARRGGGFHAPTRPVYAAPRSANERVSPVRIGIARDEAFHFYYEDLFDVLEEIGCECVFFSPLHDRSLPEGLGGLYLGGGYPEEFAFDLSGNASMMDEIRAFAAQGRPLYTECGGLMYLSRTIATTSGHSHPLVGLVPAEVRMLERRKTLGYMEVTLAGETLLGKEGATLRGHEFHYSELTGEFDGGEDWKRVYRVKRPLGEMLPPEGYRCGNILASYIHLHLPSRPEALAHFVGLCGRDS